MLSGQFDPLRPDLREAAETLEQALADACAGKSAHEADTGELLRIEEMLAVAGEAARRAIAIRREVRKAGQEAAAAGPPADQPAPHRLFTDKAGTQWDVWAVYPGSRSSQVSALPSTFQSGWLVFESASEKRRLSPIPADWQTLPVGDLEQLCDRAEIAQRRGRVLGGGGLGEGAPPRSE